MNEEEFEKLAWKYLEDEEKLRKKLLKRVNMIVSHLTKMSCEEERADYLLKLARLRHHKNCIIIPNEIHLSNKEGKTIILKRKEAFKEIEEAFKETDKRILGMRIVGLCYFANHPNEMIGKFPKIHILTS